MDILTNYYNAAGQIINRVPDLKSREFYRDYMCRHRFNEMFVAAQQHYGPTCSIVADCMWYDFCGGSGVSIPEITDSGSPLIIAGYNGRKALTCAGDSDQEIDLGTQYDNTWEGAGTSITGDVRCGLIFKSPSQIATQAGSFLYGTLAYLNTEDNSILYNDTNNAVEYIMFSFMMSEISSSEIRCYLTLTSVVPLGASSGEIKTAVDSPLLLDGAWHVLTLYINISGTWVACIDGAQVATFSSGREISRFYRPALFIALYGAESESCKYAIDSAWIKKI